MIATWNPPHPRASAAIVHGPRRSTAARFPNPVSASAMSSTSSPPVLRPARRPEADQRRRLTVHHTDRQGATHAVELTIPSHCRGGTASSEVDADSANGSSSCQSAANLRWQSDISRVTPMASPGASRVTGDTSGSDTPTQCSPCHQVRCHNAHLGSLSGQIRSTYCERAVASNTSHAPGESQKCR